ncbi:hypothetical protein [Spirosoma validum]|uniref:Uncharacterized protein n=1 Tax=Spirosoma validum TaxID=2771355 RepID=A0A927GH89_9BACT|nr:hypothetical protein [Spirosoma validum]MBD2757420.1 hypothetical protein [Spirosoma validum]
MPSSTRRPTSVQNASRLLVLCLGIELLSFAFSGSYSIGAVLGVLIGGFLCYLLIRQVYSGANWARLVLVFLISLGFISSLVTFRTGFARNPGATIIDLFSTLFTLLAAALLFTRKSTTWFRDMSRLRSLG